MIAWYPEEYDIKSAWEFAQKLSFIGCETLLDIGSGNGKITAGLSSMLPAGKVIGIDPSPEMITYSSYKYNRKTFPNLEFILVDVRDLNFTNMFNIVFSITTIQWLINHKTTLSLVHKCLKPGGKIFFQVSGMANHDYFIKLAADITQNDRWKQYFKESSYGYGFYKITEYQKRLRDAGFQGEQITLTSGVNKINKIDDLKKYIKTSFSSYLTKLPENMKSLFIEETTDAYINQNPPDRDGNFHISTSRLEVEAIK